ncbi:MAG: N-acyl homoserine lactonase family protein [Solirubrobacterales bacterium]|nr:N-acyl homoserine lactonase family protein [Solirubrobacterales bacterium]
MAEIDTPVLRTPLPGGSAGAFVTLRPFSTGESGVPRGFLHRIDEPLAYPRALWRGARRRFDHWTPCPIFLLEHPKAGRILIDTGLPAATAHDPKAALGPVASRMYVNRATEEQPLPARLRALGISRGGIDVVVMTHLHFDHAGSLNEVEDAVVVVNKKEWRSAHAGKALARGYIRKQFDLGHDIRLVDFEAAEVNSFASFGRSVDLFGDQTVVLVSTPGHTSGHMSVVVKLKDRECLIAGDAVYSQRALSTGDLPLILADEHNYKRSVREIRAYKQMTPSALIIPGHDADFFASLEESY